MCAHTAVMSGASNTAALDSNILRNKQTSGLISSETVPEKGTLTKEPLPAAHPTDKNRDLIGEDIMKAHQKELEWSRKKLAEQDEQMQVK